MPKSKELKIFAVHDKDGKLTRLVEAYTVKEVKDHLLQGVTITTASALTVSRSGLKAEKASPV